MRADRAWLLGLLGLSGCGDTFLPLRGKIDVGQDPMVLFVGGDAPAGGDLYVSRGDGGGVIQITFTAVGEMRPALSPEGTAVAFLRGGSLGDSTPAGVWLLSLRSGVERQVELPPGAGAPHRVGWTDGGRSIVVSAGQGLYRATIGPGEILARPVDVGRRAAAESALAVVLGDPAFARVEACDGGDDLCVVGDSGPPSVFARGAREPARWGDDSVAYLEGDRLLVRPLGPGRARAVEWSALPPRPRQPTVFPGASAARR